MKRIVVGLAAILGALTLFIGVAHTQLGRPLLAYMPWSPSIEGVCPLGYDAPATVQARAAAQRQFASTHRGERAAVNRPALGFALDSATKADIQTWAAAQGVTCLQPRRGHDLECQRVPSRALPTPGSGSDVHSLWLDFGPDNKLVSVIALRRNKDVNPIIATFAQIKDALTQGTGAPADDSVQVSSAELQAGLLRQATAEYRFTNYYAVARATNMPDGFLLTEEYHSLN